jgi:hypothetical protein
MRVAGPTGRRVTRSRPIPRPTDKSEREADASLAHGTTEAQPLRFARAKSQLSRLSITVSTNLGRRLR